MLSKNNQTVIKNIRKILNSRISYKKGNLFHLVNYILKKKSLIINLTNKYKTPFYVFDQKALDNSIERFSTAFKKEIRSFKPYYAIKINHHPLIVKRAIENGMGLDVGSPREIDIAINAGCKDIIYFSPGKTKEDILHAIKHSDVVTTHIDSLRELEKLGFLTNKHKKKIRAGVRIHTDQSGNWKKYGIHINEATAKILVACARAAALMKKQGAKGAFTILDIPPGYLSSFSREETVRKFM